MRFAQRRLLGEMGEDAERSRELRVFLGESVRTQLTSQYSPDRLSPFPRELGIARTALCAIACG